MLKRSVAILATTACLAFVLAPNAQAAPPDELESYTAGASASALLLTLLGQEIGLSATTAAVSSSPQPTAAADGAALLLAGNPIPGAAPSLTPGGNPSAQQCPGVVDLGALTGGALTGLDLEIACLNTSATVTDGAPDAVSESGQVSLVVQGLGGAVLEPVLAPIVDALVDGLTQAEETVLCGGLLAPVCDLVDQTTQIDLEELIAELIADIDALDDGTFTVAQIAVAPTRSHAGASAETGVVAEAGSNAVTVSLFPGLLSTIADLTGLGDDTTTDDALLTVRLSSSNAEVVRSATTGAPQPTGSAAQLLGIETTDSLGLVSSILGGTVPQLLDALAAPLAALSCTDGLLADLVCIDLGDVNELDAAELEARGYDYGTGTVGIEASAANVYVLPILEDAFGGDVLSLQLGQSSAAANATPAQDAPPPSTPEDPETERPLPTTGGTPALPLAVLLFGAAAAAAVLVRRSRTV